MPAAPLPEIRETFALLDDWEDRYRYVIELGKSLPVMPDDGRVPENIVHGCQSQVWIRHHVRDGRLVFELDSDALIVRGLIAIVLAALDDKTPEELLAVDVDALFDELALKRHLSPSRGNGLSAMVERIRRTALQASRVATG
jgi:cysteine desulfuration protein SufE